MQVFTIAHNKGGVSKSTLTFNLYAYYKSVGINVCIIDADIQGSILAAKETFKDSFTDVQVFAPPKDWKELKSWDYDLILIDTPPFNFADITNILEASQLCIIPTKLGVYDRLAVLQTIKRLKQVQATKPALKACIVFSQLIDNSSYYSDMMDSFKTLGVPVMDQAITNRVAYNRSLMNPLGVFSENDGKAKSEVNTLANQLLHYMLKK